jgi:photosystem II stability/assembly factor-like uncharacterized protein
MLRSIVVAVIFAFQLAAADVGFPSLLDSFTYRNLGPFRTGAWVSDVAVPEFPVDAHLYTFYVAARTGGVWKTTNNGVTFEPIFEHQNVSSIGAIAVSPKDPNVVWVGTGDASCTRSAYWGDGVYKTLDGGKTWASLGLKDSQHISRIVINPKNPNNVLVAAMGHLYSPNDERGVFQTSDGGKTWKKVLFVSDQTGAIDLVMDRRNPQVLYAAMYQCRRYGWKIADGGTESGIFQSIDGGNNWKKLAGGLPTGPIGRIGLDVSYSSPDTVYAVLDNFNPRESGGGKIGGEVYRTDDGGRAWRKTSSDRDDVSRKAGYSFNQIRVDPANPNHIFVTGSNLIDSEDGGKTWAGLGRTRARVFRRAFGDYRSLWIDPRNPKRMIASSDGAVSISYDGGITCDHYNNLPLGEVYALDVDNEKPYNIYAGLQDHENWKGPSNGPNGSIGVEDWVTTGIGDGMYNQVDPTDSRWLYNTQEFGSPARLDQKLHVRTVITPTRPAGQPRLRFNWTTPIRISPNNPATIYLGAQVLFRSTDRGDHWQEISPDLTSNDPEKVSGPGTGIQFCTITTISESPVASGVIWVGTDDGKVQVTRDGGTTWVDATSAIAKAGGPDDGWVTRVYAGRFAAGTAYVAKSRRRYDDFRPFLFVTADFGKTWKAIVEGLPQQGVNAIIEDTKFGNLLFAGTDSGIFASQDGGAHWVAFKANMPTVPVHDLAIQAREGDLVAGTYGRGIWIANIGALRELTPKALTSNLFLFDIRRNIREHEGAFGNFRLSSDRDLTVPNEPNGLDFTYLVRSDLSDKVTLTVTDAAGKVVHTVDGPQSQGIHHIAWTVRGGGESGPNRNSGPVPHATERYTVTIHSGSLQQTRDSNP